MFGWGAPGGTDQVKIEYNLDGTVAKKTFQKHQAGDDRTVISYVYDGTFHRLVRQSVDTVGTGVDDAIRSITYAYDSQGRMESTKSCANADGTGVANEVKVELAVYAPVSAGLRDFQEHKGSKGDATPCATSGISNYSSPPHDELFSHGLRLNRFIYPNGRNIYYTYGSDGSLADKVSRLDAIRRDSWTGNPLATYSYSGAGRLVREEFAEPNVRLDYFGGTSGTYAGFDRFGRVKQQLWRNYGAGQDLDKFTYGYDRNSNRLYRRNVVDPNYSELYHPNDPTANTEYDGLDRLREFRRGVLSDSNRSITGTPKRSQTWTLDALGNWASNTMDGNSTQTRTHNLANEITDLSDTANDPANPQPGDKVRFVAKMKNIGDGATPPGVQCGVSFYVDGKHVGWCTRPGPMKAGEEWTLTADGGGQFANGQWLATAGHHALKVFADDINRLPGERSKANNIIDQSLYIGPPTKGLLLGASAPAQGQADLTNEGSLEWIHFGYSDKSAVNRKAGGPGLLSALTSVGEGHTDRTSGCPVSIKWSDGAATKAVADTHDGLWWNCVKHAQSFTVAADDKKTRVVRLYVVGIEGAGCTLTARLSDDSAPAYVSSSWNGNLGHGDWAPVPDGFSAVYTVRFRAASPDQKLTVEWKLTSEPNRFLGQARLQAATLAVEP